METERMIQTMAFKFWSWLWNRRLRFAALGLGAYVALFYPLVPHNPMMFCPSKYNSYDRLSTFYIQHMAGAYMDYGIRFRVDDGMIYTAAIDTIYPIARSNTVHLVREMDEKYFTRIIFGLHDPKSNLYPQRWHDLHEVITDINKSPNRQTSCRLLYAVAVEGTGWKHHGVPIIESEIRTYW